MFLKKVMKTARVIHRWMGASLAVLLILVSATGTLLIWKNTYLGFVFPQSALTFERSIEPMATIALSADAAFGAAAISQIEFGDQSFGLSKVYLVDKRSAYIAPDGQILAVWEPNGRFEDWLLDLHHRLLTGTVGLYIVGLAGIAALVVIGAGLIAYWPARRSWKLGLALRSLKRPELLRLHRNTGILLALPIAVVIFAGVVLAFPETSRKAFFWSYEDDDSYGQNFGDGVDAVSGSSETSWPKVLARAAAVFPDAEITGLAWPEGTGVKRVLIRESGEWSERGNSSVHITDYDGYMDLRIDARTLPIGEKTYNFLGDLHRSHLGGWIYNIIQTLIGLSLICLGVIGLISFVGARFSSASQQ